MTPHFETAETTISQSPAHILGFEVGPVERCCCLSPLGRMARSHSCDKKLRPPYIGYQPGAPGQAFLLPVPHSATAFSFLYL